jgi:hypothetical protein
MGGSRLAFGVRRLAFGVWRLAFGVGVEVKGGTLGCWACGTLQMKVGVWRSVTTGEPRNVSERSFL